MEQILVFDTTLRDGEQSPGATMTTPEKIRVAQELEALGVDIIEAGFPISSPQEFEGVNAVAKAVERPIIAGLARATNQDVDRAAEALKHAAHPRIHTFLATSDLHLERKLKISRDEALRRIERAVSRARQQIKDVEFSAEDATRTELDFLCRAVQVAIEAGAQTINLPDTVGYAHPADIERMLQAVATVPGIDRITLSVHCHDDLGLAVANSLMGIENGARQIECTVNGIGERAGNASLEEIVMAIRVLPRYYDQFTTNIVTELLCPTSEMLAHVTGIRPQPNKAIVGANAFAHEAGIHQDGLLKDRRTLRDHDAGDGGRAWHPAGAGEALWATRARTPLYRARLRPFDRRARPGLRAVHPARRSQEGRARRGPARDLLRGHHGGCSARLQARVPGGALRAGSVGGCSTTLLQCGDRSRRCGRPGMVRSTPPSRRSESWLRGRCVWRSSPFQAAGGGKDAVGEVHLTVRVGGNAFWGRAASTDIVDAAARALLNALDKADHARGLEARAFARMDLWAV